MSTACHNVMLLAVPEKLPQQTKYSLVACRLETAAMRALIPPTPPSRMRCQQYSLTGVVTAGTDLQTLKL